ncbi:MAG: sulfite exporter TauE/SafE family protein, partial [Acetobacteraceae bacterium]
LAGAYAFGALGGGWADLIVGGFLIVSVLLRRTLAGQTLAATLPVLAIGGAATGLLSGITTGAGMLLIPLLLGAGLPARALIATDAFVSGSMHVARVAGYAAGGVLGPALVVLGLALGAATVPGSRAAAWLVARIPPWKHVVILEGLVVVIGAMTVWGAVRALRAA